MKQPLHVGPNSKHLVLSGKERMFSDPATRAPLVGGGSLMAETSSDRWGRELRTRDYLTRKGAP